MSPPAPLLRPMAQIGHCGWVLQISGFFFTHEPFSEGPVPTAGGGAPGTEHHVLAGQHPRHCRAIPVCPRLQLQLAAFPRALFLHSRRASSGWLQISRPQPRIFQISCLCSSSRNSVLFAFDNIKFNFLSQIAFTNNLITTRLGRGTRPCSIQPWTPPLPAPPRSGRSGSEPLAAPRRHLPRLRSRRRPPVPPPARPSRQVGAPNTPVSRIPEAGEQVGPVS